MKVVVLSANLGAYDVEAPWVDQDVPAGVDLAIHRFTDRNFPPRPLAMTSRLQCGIPKMFGWQMVPGADVYIWIDASRALQRRDTVAWFLEQLGGAELLAFRHPERATIREEYDFVKARLARPGERYLTSRYAGEWLDAQYAAATPPWYVDDRLYASTAFAYRPTLRVQAAFRDWWVHKSRYLLHDQLAWPYVLREHHVRVKELADNVYTCPHLPMVRPSQSRRLRTT